MSIVQQLKQLSVKAFETLYQLKLDGDSIIINETKPEFDGDYTIVLFPFVKQVSKSPQMLGEEVGEWLLGNAGEFVQAFQPLKGFLNITLQNEVWLNFLRSNLTEDFGRQAPNNQKIMVEYSSPNTNKPLHLGHLRNNFLGWSLAEIYAWNGCRVMKTAVVNDRGIHICKSMLAWKLYGNGETPASTGVKGDHFVGTYYVRFEQELQKEVGELQTAIQEGKPTGMLVGDAAKISQLQLELQGLEPGSETYLKKGDDLKEALRNATPIMQQVRTMLVKWEEGDAETMQLWSMMNGWVYEGFDETYRRIGSNFDKVYYESKTYLLGKQFVQQGLEGGVFYKRPDGSVWIDLSAEGYDEKLVLRKDGTSVYITQDIGLGQLKFDDFEMQQSMYVVGDEQNYHMQVLKLICQKLKLPFADGIYHVSYGMVDLPTGRMKSREGTVVDADDLCDEMEAVAAAKTAELGKVNDFNASELKQLFHILAMGSLKFFLLRVDPKKRMVFNPEESIDFHGFTGPFVQYSYARIQSVLRKAGTDNFNVLENYKLHPLEKKIVLQLEQFPSILHTAAVECNPSVVATFVFNLAKQYNSFYAELSILKEAEEVKRHWRLQLSQFTGYVIKNALHVLGIQVPARM